MSFLVNVLSWNKDAKRCEEDVFVEEEEIDETHDARPRGRISSHDWSCCSGSSSDGEGCESRGEYCRGNSLAPETPPLDPSMLSGRDEKGGGVKVLGGSRVPGCTAHHSRGRMQALLGPSGSSEEDDCDDCTYRDDGRSGDEKESDVQMKARYFEELIGAHQAKQAAQNRGGMSALQYEESSKEMKDEMSRLKAALEESECARKKMASELQIRTQEVQNLTTVVRQLSESRADALAARADMAEKMCELQREISRVSYVANLTREVSKEHVELTKEARRQAAHATAEMEKVKREVQDSIVAEKKASMENARLKQELLLLERMDLQEHTLSVCSREYRDVRVSETY